MSTFASNLPEASPVNADATPVFDTWGPNFLSGYWSLQDWITWHQANVAEYGQGVANSKFVAAWNQNSFGASPVNELEFDTSARQYLAAAGALQQIPASLFGTLNDLIQGAGNVTSQFPATASAVATVSKYALPVGVLIALYFFSRSSGDDPVKEGKKVGRGALNLGKKIFA